MSRLQGRHEAQVIEDGRLRCACGAEMRVRSAPCPDGRADCLVLHVQNYCPVEAEELAAALAKGYLP